MDDLTFKGQILEDIKLLQKDYRANNPLLEKDDYAFNYWVLTKLYNIDEEVVENNITEYSDDGCDCYAFFEESKELYIIQNKFYSDDTKLQESYVVKDFLYRPLNTLCESSYKRSVDLQNIFNKYKNDSEFKIYLNLYVTNNNVSESLRDRFIKYSYSGPDIKCYIEANLYTLGDIKNIYYEDRKKHTKNFTCIFKTKNDGTVLNINSDAYDLPSLTDAKYILTPVKLIYEVVKEAKAQDYMLFEENIREYLGNKGVNAKIAKTLESDDDRDNFFYYNNGITVICDSVTKETLAGDSLCNRGFRTNNPQIVNGCQTVNTIYETLNKYPVDELDSKFKNTYVMVKLLVLDKNDESNRILYQDIVKYNNSQNSINEKNFAANKQIFVNMQKDLKKHGFLLAVKQSDPYQFKKNESFNNYRPRLSDYEILFGLSFTKLDDIIIPLDKLLQVILAFKQDGWHAFTKKNQLLKLDSQTYLNVIEYIKNGELTISDLINMYLLWLKAEKEKKLSEDQKTPIPYYLLGFLGAELKGIVGKEFVDTYRYIFSTKEIFDTVYDFYKRLTKRYKINYKNDKLIEYNQMIKSQIDSSILDKTISDEFEMLDSPQAKEIIRNFRNHNVHVD